MPRVDALRRHFDDLGQQRSAADLGMWTFLATEVLFFGAPLLIYLVARFDFSAAFAEASARLDTELGLLNTVVLLTSSLAMAYADAFAEREHRRSAVACLLVTAALGLTFLAIKFFEYRSEYAEGLLPIAAGAFDGPDAPGQRAFFGFYLFLTTLHAAHLLIGIGAVGFIAVLSRRGTDDPTFRTRTRVTALYWHFVDVVWIFLFPWLYLVK